MQLSKLDRFFLHFLLTFLFFSTLISCNYNDKKIELSFKLAGNNREELLKIINHYKRNPADSLKYRAAKFLIENCIIYSYTTNRLVDPNGQSIKFFPPGFKSIDAVEKAKDSLMCFYSYTSNTLYDCQTINSQYLINHIDRMFSIWKSSPWYKKINFDMFCKYILPYRASSEPLSQWLSDLQSKYLPMITSHDNILTAAIAINNEMAKNIKYNNCWIGGFGIQSVKELTESHSGMCDDLAAYGVCTMRACGIPAAVDFTLWAKTNMGHSWGVIFNELGKPFSFGPGEQNPGKHIEIFSQIGHRRLSKVFRRSFQINYSGLWAKVTDPQTIPPFFGQMNISDVTSEYIKTSDITIPVKATGIKNNLAYICIYNSHKWTPIHWTKIVNNHAKFSEMGNGLLYMVAQFERHELIPISDPFIYNTESNIQFLTGNQGEIKNINVEKKLLGIGALTPFNSYQLFKWENNEWEFCSNIITGNDSKLVLPNMNEQTLYRVEGNSRPFTIKEQKIVWW